jgi:hypothetical protein
VVALWFELLFWPIRPIRTPKPIASSRTPTPATSVVPEETRWACDGRGDRVRPVFASVAG